MRRQIWKFLCLVWGEWASRVTGSLSAILVLAGLGMNLASVLGWSIRAESIIQLTTWLLAAICGAQAAFAVWSHEHNKRIELEEKLEPRLKLLFDNNMCIQSYWSEYPDRAMWVVRVRVRNESNEQVSSCVLNHILTTSDGIEHPQQLCAPFSLLIDETGDIDVLEYGITDRVGRLIIPYGTLENNVWVHEPGIGLVVDNCKKLVFEALSSNSPSIRIILVPERISEATLGFPRWRFDIIVSAILVLCLHYSG